jgi:3-hydroxyacyl-[acyl-carrier-protein] dehydratase
MASTAVPLAAVDDITVLSPYEVVAAKTVRADDPYLVGHYPGRPIYPGVFVLETVRQALDGLLSRGGQDRTATLTGVPSMRMFTPLEPGDELGVHVTCERAAPGEVTATARCSRNGAERVAVLTVTFLPTVGGAA